MKTWDDLEVNLGELAELYPTIPAIEVTIPHVFCLLISSS
jgi:hypothetical protein